MSALMFTHKPNKIPSNPGAPADTNFHDLTIPSGVILGAGVEVAINCTTATGTAAGSTMFISDTAATDASTWFPILPGQTLVLSAVGTLSYKCTVGTDVPYFLWMF